MDHIWTAGSEIKWSYDPRSYERNFCNCVKKPEKFRTSTGFELVTSWYRCDALTNWAMRPLTLGAGHLWVLIFPWGMNQRWNDIWNGSYMNCGYEIKWSYDPRSYERNFCNCIKKPENFRTSMGFEPVTLRYRCKRSNQLSYEATAFITARIIASLDIWSISYNHFIVVSGFVAQLVRVSHRYREVTGSNHVEVLNFSVEQSWVESSGAFELSTHNLK